MIFRKNVKKGGGSFPFQKVSLRFFCFKTPILVMIFRKNVKKGGVISNLKNLVANLVRFGPVWKKIATFFPEKGAGWGGQRPFGNFPEIHRYLKRQASLSGVDIWLMRFHFLAGIKRIFENPIFRAPVGLFSPKNYIFVNKSINKL